MIPSTQVIDPSEYDLVVLGTGFVEAAVAAAAAKAGKTVLQLDPASSYGGAWTSVALNELIQSSEIVCGLDAGEPSATQPGEPSTADHNCELLKRGVERLGLSSSYALDLAPKVIYGGGPLIEMLLDSGAHNYTEFKLIQGSYVYRDGRLQSVPSSRSEVFKDRSLGLQQKRALMKFLKTCSEGLQQDGQRPQEHFDERPFTDVLGAAGLDSQLQELLVHAVLMLDHAQQAEQQAACTQAGQATPSSTHSNIEQAECNPPGRTPQPSSAAPELDPEAGDERAAAASGGSADLRPATPTAAGAAVVEGGCADGPACKSITAAAALQLLDVHMRSLGRYGQDAGPFLTPMYGGGELPQAFCRSAAVQGAVQVLRCQLAGPVFDEHSFSCMGVELSSGQVIRCRHLAASQDLLQEWLHTFRPSSTTATTHRCTAVLSEALVPGEGQSLLVVPPGTLGHTAHAVRGLVLSSSTRVCPEGRALLYLWTPSDGTLATAADALMPVLDSLVDTSALGGTHPPALHIHLSSRSGRSPGRAAAQQAQQARHERGQASVDAPCVGQFWEHEGSAGAQRGSEGGGFGTGGAAAGIAGAPEGGAPPPDGTPPGASHSSEGAHPIDREGEQQGGCRPRALLATFSSHHQVKVAGRQEGRWPSNVVLCPGPDHTATYLTAVQDAKECFARLYPEIPRFPFDRSAEDATSAPGSDDEDLQALAAALDSAGHAKG